MFQKKHQNPPPPRVRIHDPSIIMETGNGKLGDTVTKTDKLHREKAIKALAAEFIAAQLRYREIHNSFLKSNIVESAVEIATKLHDCPIPDK